jgi:hypothetical protein
MTLPGFLYHLLRSNRHEVSCETIHKLDCEVVCSAISTLCMFSEVVKSRLINKQKDHTLMKFYRTSIQNKFSASAVHYLHGRGQRSSVDLFPLKMVSNPGMAASFSIDRSGTRPMNGCNPSERFSLLRVVLV